jgi:hypothetical protein
MNIQRGLKSTGQDVLDKLKSFKLQDSPKIEKLKDKGKELVSKGKELVDKGKEIIEGKKETDKEKREKELDKKIKKAKEESKIVEKIFLDDFQKILQREQDLKRLESQTESIAAAGELFSQRAKKLNPKFKPKDEDKGSQERLNKRQVAKKIKNVF